MWTGLAQNGDCQGEESNKGETLMQATATCADLRDLFFSHSLGRSAVANSHSTIPAKTSALLQLIKAASMCA